MVLGYHMLLFKLQKLKNDQIRRGKHLEKLKIGQEQNYVYQRLGPE